MTTELQDQVRLEPLRNPAEANLPAVQQVAAFSLVPKNLSEAMEFATILSKSTMVPKAYKDAPGDVLVAVQFGAELGLKPLQALQSIANINGRPGLFGDAMVAIVRSHPEFEYLKEWFDPKTETAFCSIKRKGEDEETRSFSFDDARKAQLWGKAGPWTQYARRQAGWRAKSWACRDVFADALRGIGVREELIDITPESDEPARTTSTKQAIAAAAGNARTPIEGESTRSPEPAAAETGGGPPSTGRPRPLAEVFVDIEAMETKDQVQALMNEIAAMPLGEGRSQAGSRWSARLKLLKQIASGDAPAEAKPAIDKGTGEVQDDFVREMREAEERQKNNPPNGEDVPQ